jgi:hypothetical protein
VHCAVLAAERACIPSPEEELDNVVRAQASQERHVTTASSLVSIAEAPKPTE